MNPNPSKKEVVDLANQYGCSTQTAYAALKDVRDANLEEMIKQGLVKLPTSYVPPPPKPKPRKKSKKKTSKKKSTKKKTTYGTRRIPPPAPSPELKKKGMPPGSTTKKRVQKLMGIPKIKSNVSLEDFCRLWAIPLYKGLYRWQIQLHKETWHKRIVLVKAPRDHGKSIYLGNLCQWALSAKGYDIIYLGWTDRRKEVAESVYTFFVRRTELAPHSINSNYHFETTYGTKFDCYLTMAKDILGMHDVGILDRVITDENRYLEEYVRDENRKLLMIIDDPIDDRFKDERHLEKKLERRYDSTISNINPDKTICTGTHKFEDDFLHYFEKVEPRCYVFKRGTHIKPGNPRYNKEPDNPTNLLCPERWIEEGAPYYDVYKMNKDLELTEDEERKLFNSFHPKRIKKMRKKWEPIFRKKDLTEKKAKTKPYWWYAEYEQEPKTIKGTVFSKVHYIPTFGNWFDFTAFVISIDRATTKNKKSALTGIIIELMRSDFKRVVYQDLSQKIDIDACVVLIEETFQQLKSNFHKVQRYKVIVEKQGGGDDFITLAENMGAEFANVIEPIHSKLDKEDRIKDYLKTPITRGLILFPQSLKNSEVMKEIEDFPNSDKVDAVDALAYADFILRTLKGSSDPEKMKETLQRKIDQIHEAKLQRQNREPWEIIKERNQRNQRMRRRMR